MRTRDVVALLIGLTVVGAAAYALTIWLNRTVESSEPPEDPAEAIVAPYLDLWAAGDHLAMVDLVRDAPIDFLARHAQLRDGLEVESLELSHGPPESSVDGQMTFPVTVEATVSYATSPLTWETELDLIRERGNWLVDWSPQVLHPQLRDNWEFGIEREAVSRREILARDGTPLAGSAPLVTFGFEPTAVTDKEAVIAAFAEAIPGSESTAERELNRTNLTDGWFYPVVTVPERRADEAAPRLREADGILRQTGRGRALYDEGFAQHLIGVVDEATAEQLEQLGEAGSPGIEIGQYGLERVFESQLVGSELVRAGLKERSQTGDTPLRLVIAETQADPSSPLTTTLDIDVQQAIENALIGIDATVGFVATDAADGAVLGSASRPLSGYNRAFEGRYPPGSTFKIITAEALLESGIQLDEEVDCPAEATIGGLRVPNAAGMSRGTVTFREAFAYSCNTTFAALGARLQPAQLQAAAERFGFGTSVDLPLTAFSGSYPEPVDTAEQAAASFGQARVEASVLHMATVAGAAGTGNWNPPYLLADADTSSSRSLATGTSDRLIELLRQAVVDGTGELADVEGIDIIGKTGTAQAQGDVEHAWFVGLVGDISFAILVEDGGSGGQVAAPIAARFAQELQGLRE